MDGISRREALDTMKILAVESPGYKAQQIKGRREIEELSKKSGTAHQHSHPCVGIFGTRGVISDEQAPGVRRQRPYVRRCFVYHWWHCQLYVRRGILDRRHPPLGPFILEELISVPE
jgi:hypothetical protein